MEAGADDYLTKPFNDRELLARVGAHLEMVRIRRDAEEGITRIFDSIPDGVIIHDPEWRYSYVNGPAERMLGRTRSDLLGKSLWEEFPFVVGSDIERHLRRAADEQVLCEFEGYNQAWNRWYENRPFPMPGGGIAVYFRDITERKRDEEALRRSEQRFRRYFDLGLIGMAITSPTKCCLDVNDKMCQILGYPREELLEKTWAEMTHPNDLAEDLVQFEKVIAGEIEGYVLEKHWIRKDGRVIDTAIAVRCVRTPDKKVDYFVALLQDITEHKRAETALRRSEQRFRGTFENAAVGIAHRDLAGCFLRVNETFCKITGYTCAELLQMSFRDIVHPDDLAAELELHAPLVRRELASYSLEKRLVRKDGSLVWVDLFVSLQADTSGDAGYIISVIADISAQ